MAILGDIIGLAERAEPDHKNVGAYAAKKGVDLLIAVGDDARYYAQGASGLMEEENIRYFPKKEDFIRIKDSLLREGDVIPRQSFPRHGNGKDRKRNHKIRSRRKIWNH